MRIGGITEEVNMYERHLREARHAGKAESLKKIREVSGRVLMLVGGIEHEIERAKTKEDAKTVGELMVLLKRTSTMYEGYVLMARGIGVELNEKGQTT